MLYRTIIGKNGKKKKEDSRNTFYHNALRTSLIFGVFATNSAAGCLHANYERGFVKKIQHLFDEETHLSLSTSFVPLVGWFSCLALSRSEGTLPHDLFGANKHQLLGQLFPLSVAGYLNSASVHLLECEGVVVVLGERRHQVLAAIVVDDLQGGNVLSNLGRGEEPFARIDAVSQETRHRTQ